MFLLIYSRIQDSKKQKYKRWFLSCKSTVYQYTLSVTVGSTSSGRQMWERGLKSWNLCQFFTIFHLLPDNLLLTLEWEKLNINKEALALANSFDQHITSICIKTFKALSTIHICCLIYFCNIYWARGRQMLSPFSKWKMWSAKGWYSKSKENQNSGYNTKSPSFQNLFFSHGY